MKKIYDTFYRLINKCIRVLRLANSIFILICLAFYNFFRKIFRLQAKSDEVIVLVPSRYKAGELYATGSNKDIESALECLQENGVAFKSFGISKNPVWGIYEIFYKHRIIRLLISSKQIIISMPGSIFFLLTVLRFTCKAQIIVRSHNAELLHRLEYFKLAKNFHEKIFFMKKSLQGFSSDFLCTLFANQILVINDYEIKSYWNKINPFMKSKFLFFPYRPPVWSSHKNSERNHVLILGGLDPKTYTNTPEVNFLEAAPSINSFVELNKLRLISIGTTLNETFKYEYFSYVENLLDILNSTKVLLVPSRFGWGFKTKIGDALFLNQTVIVPRNLYNKVGIWKAGLIAIDDWSEINSIIIEDNINNSSLFDYINLCRSNTAKSLFLEKKE
jgi:hypothetical protein